MWIDSEPSNKELNSNWYRERGNPGLIGNLRVAGFQKGICL